MQQSKNQMLLQILFMLKYIFKNVSCSFIDCCRDDVFFSFFLVGQPAIYHHPILLNKTAVEVQMESDMKTKGKSLLDWCSPNNKQIQQKNSKVHTETWRRNKCTNTRRSRALYIQIYLIGTFQSKEGKTVRDHDDMQSWSQVRFTTRLSSNWHTTESAESPRCFHLFMLSAHTDILGPRSDKNTTKVITICHTFAAKSQSCAYFYPLASGPMADCHERQTE